MLIKTYCRTIVLNRSGELALAHLNGFICWKNAGCLRSAALRQNGWGQPFYTVERLGTTVLHGLHPLAMANRHARVALLPHKQPLLRRSLRL